jgi:hypothetical protein
MSQSQNPPGDFWAITSYFNPFGYRNRYLNYQTFRQKLNVPLLTVELAYGDDFELKAGDATQLVQLRSDQVMWQKDRLLNLAIAALPPECRIVAWLDCDVLFERDDWASLTSEALEQYDLVQCFSQSYVLNREIDWSQPLRNQSYIRRDAMATRYTRGYEDLQEPDAYAGTLRAHGVFSNISSGYAWAMRREAIARLQIYDTCILGGGIMALAYAAVGQFKQLIDLHLYNPARSRNYLEWAERFYGVVQGKLGGIPGDIYPLWHGELEDRGYESRHSLLNQLDFDPYQDIAIDENGSWRWNSDRPDLHDAARAHFQRRREDGRETSSDS